MMRLRRRALSAVLPIVGRASALFLLSSLTVGCTTPQERRAPGLDCGPLEADSPFEWAAMARGFGWFSFGDDAPGAIRGTDIPEGGGLPNPPAPDSDIPEDIQAPCNAWSQVSATGDGLTSMPTTGLLRFHSGGHTQWGSGFGMALSFRDSDPRNLPPDLTDALNIPPARDGSPYEGIAFWAQSAHQKDRTVSVEIQTAQTAKPYDGTIDFLEENLRIRTCLSVAYDLPIPEQLVEENPCDCREPAEADGAVNARVNPDGTLTLEGSEPRPGDCGNVFRRQVTLSEHWQLYLLPFREFWQEGRPNRVSNGLDASRIYQFGIRVDLEKSVDFLTTQWVFYKHDDYEPPEREDSAADCVAPDWDISYPQDPDAGGEGEAPTGPSTAETECISTDAQ